MREVSGSIPSSNLPTSPSSVSDNWGLGGGGGGSGGGGGGGGGGGDCDIG